MRRQWQRVADDPLARLLGPGWERLRWGQLAARAHRHELAAGFIPTLAAYMLETETWTAAEALTRLHASRLADAEEWRDAPRHLIA